jgi:protein transport protein SEC61 subunit gamma and related proteins
MPEPTSPPSRDDEETLDQVVEAETAPKAKAHASDAHRTRAGQDAGFIDRAWESQRKIEQKWASLGSGRFARVLRMARKPEPEEFRQSATIVLVGIAVIGGIGFAVYLLLTWLLKAVGA